MSNLSLPDQLIDDIANQSTKHAQGWTRLPIKILVDDKYLDDGNKKKNPSHLSQKKFKVIT